MNQEASLMHHRHLEDRYIASRDCFIEILQEGNADAS
jgi:hypothetical protein